MTPTNYEPPRVTFVGADPKIPALMKAIGRAARTPGIYWGVVCETEAKRRFVSLWQARNRRTRVLIKKVQRANLT